MALGRQWDLLDQRVVATNDAAIEEDSSTFLFIAFTYKRVYNLLRNEKLYPLAKGLALGDMP